MQNNSGLKPLGHACLVQAYEPEIKAGTIYIPENVRDRTSMVEQRAIFIEAGPSAWKDETMPRAKPGDKVLVSKYAGFSAIGPADGKRYRLINGDDVFCAITDETFTEQQQAERSGTHG